jgi:hypothetical protein
LCQFSDGTALGRSNGSQTNNSIGNAQILKQMEMIENSLRDNTKIVITEHGINPTLFLGSLPVSVSNEKSAK